VSERKLRSGTILDFGLRILDSKKKAISVGSKFYSKAGKLYFEVFVQKPIGLLSLNPPYDMVNFIELHLTAQIEKLGGKNVKL